MYVKKLEDLEKLITNVVAYFAQHADELPEDNKDTHMINIILLLHDLSNAHHQIQTTLLDIQKSLSVQTENELNPKQEG